MLIKAATWRLLNVRYSIIAGPEDGAARARSGDETGQINGFRRSVDAFQSVIMPHATTRLLNERDFILLLGRVRESTNNGFHDFFQYFPENRFFFFFFFSANRDTLARGEDEEEKKTKLTHAVTLVFQVRPRLIRRDGVI